MTKNLRILFNRFYKAYPLHKSKGDAEVRFEKIFKALPQEEAEDLLKEILLAIEAQKKYRWECQSAGKWQPEWKLPATWLNQKCWLDEIPSHTEIKQKKEQARCSQADCNMFVLGEKYDYCADHLYEQLWPWKDRLMQTLKDRDLWRRKDESQAQWAIRCRASLANKTYRGLVNDY